MGSIWVLAMVLRIGEFDVIIKPTAVYIDPMFAYEDCMNDKKSLEKITDIPLTCLQKEKEV